MYISAKFIKLTYSVSLHCCLFVMLGQLLLANCIRRITQSPTKANYPIESVKIYLIGL